MNRPVAILRNDVSAPAGHLARILDATGVAYTVVRADAGEPIPGVGDAGAFVVLGGEMGAYDEDAYPYLRAEKVLAVAAVEAGVPVLGICLGCQILADALGGSAYRAPRPEARFAPLDVADRLTVVAPLGRGRVLALHRDTWDLPAGARLLATSPDFPQAFSLGSALGVQVHPEVTPDIVDAWIEEGADVMIRRGGADPEELARAVREEAVHMAATADAFFGGWLRSVGLG